MRSPRNIAVAAQSTAVAIAGAVLVVAAAGPVAAAEPVIAADIGWYTSMSVSAGGVPLGDPLATNTLSSGELPVGANAQEEHKRAYLKLDVPDGATSVVIELPLSESTGTNFGVAGPILACGMAEPFIVSGGGDLADAPEVDCSVAAVGQPNADLTAGETASAYTFDLTPLLPHWEAMGESGLALVADVSEPQGFYQVTFAVALFGEVGTAEVDDRSDAGPVVPPVGSTDDPVVPPVDSSTDTSPSSTGAGGEAPEMEQFAPPVPVDEEGSGAGSPEPPVVAEPGSDPGTVPDAGEGSEATGEVRQQPAAAIPAPAPVQTLPWFVGILLGGGVLSAVGRSLDPHRRLPSDLDELLGP